MTTYNLSEKQIKADIPLHLELLPCYPITLLCLIKNFDVCEERQKEHGLISRWLISGVISLLDS